MNIYTNAGLILAAEGMDPRLFDLDMQLLHDSLLTLIAVIALFFFASYFFFNPAREFLKKRQDKIKDELDEARESLEQVKSKTDVMWTLWEHDMPVSTQEENLVFLDSHFDNADFAVRFDTVSASENGNESAEFLISANRGEAAIV